MVPKLRVLTVEGSLANATVPLEILDPLVVSVVAEVAKDTPLVLVHVMAFEPLVVQSPLISAAVMAEALPRMSPVSVDAVPVPPLATGNVPVTSAVKLNALTVMIETLDAAAPTWSIPAEAFSVPGKRRFHPAACTELGAHTPTVLAVRAQMLVEPCFTPKTPASVLPTPEVSVPASAMFPLESRVDVALGVCTCVESKSVTMAVVVGVPLNPMPPLLHGTPVPVTTPAVSALRHCVAPVTSLNVGAGIVTVPVNVGDAFGAKEVATIPESCCVLLAPALVIILPDPEALDAIVGTFATAMPESPKAFAPVDFGRLLFTIPEEVVFPVPVPQVGQSIVVVPPELFTVIGDVP